MRDILVSIKMFKSMQLAWWRPYKHFTYPISCLGRSELPLSEGVAFPHQVSRLGLRGLLRPPRGHVCRDGRQVGALRIQRQGHLCRMGSGAAAVAKATRAQVGLRGGNNVVENGERGQRSVVIRILLRVPLRIGHRAGGDVGVGRGTSRYGFQLGESRGPLRQPGVDLSRAGFRGGRTVLARRITRLAFGWHLGGAAVFGRSWLLGWERRAARASYQNGLAGVPMTPSGVMGGGGRAADSKEPRRNAPKMLRACFFFEVGASKTHDMVLSGSVLLSNFPDTRERLGDAVVLGKRGSPTCRGFSSGRMQTVALEFLLATTT